VAHDRSLDWDVLQYPVHRGLMNWVEQLNRLYRSEPALHWFDSDPPVLNGWTAMTRR